MYAVIEQGSKQYKVQAGDVIRVELAQVADDANVIEMDKVLMISDGAEIKIGAPYIDGAKVVGKFATTAEESVVKGEKVFIAYRRRRKNSQKRTGHRQKFMEVTIEEIKC